MYFADKPKFCLFGKILAQLFLQPVQK